MSLAVLADHMASKGRGPDSMLIHMSPREVQGLQALAMKNGGSLTINPETGLPEAGFLDKLLPAIIGFALAPMTAGTSLAFLGATPMASALTVGGLQTLRTGDIGKGISAGLGAYGGAGLQASLAGAGASAIGSQAAGAGAGLTGDMAYNLADAGVTDAGIQSLGNVDVANQALQQQAAERVAAATPYDKLAAGFDAAKANPSSLLTKDNFKYMAAAAGPILADQAVKSNLPTTTTQPGQIRPYSYDPYSGSYTAGNPYEVTAKKAAGGGLMGMDDGGYAPGQLNFAQQSEPVVRMAEGGIAGYAAGGFTQEQINAALQSELAARGGTSQADLTSYAKSQYGLTDAQINAAYDTLPGFNAQGKYDAADYMANSKPGQVDSQMVVDAAQAANPYSAQNMAKVDVTRPGHYVTNPVTGEVAALTNYSPGFNINNPTALTYLGELTAGGMQDDASKYFNKVATPEQKAESARLYGIEKARLDALDVAAGRLPALNADANKGLAGLNQNANASTGLPGLIPDGASYTNRFFAERGLGFDPIDTSIDNFLATYKTQLASMTPKQQEDAMRGALDKEKMNEADVVKATGMTIAQLVQAKRADGSIVVPGKLDEVPVGSLPGGVSGGGNTQVNANGTITTRPDTSLTTSAVRKAYTDGGGSLGYTSPTYTPAEFKAKYVDKLTGGSKQSYDYLTGKTPYDPVPVTKTGEIMKPYGESVLGMPSNPSKNMYVFKNGKYEVNPNYAIPTYDSKGVKSTNLTNKEVADYVASKPADIDFYNWMKTRNLSPEQVAAATGLPINEISKRFSNVAKITDDNGNIDTFKQQGEEALNFDSAAYLKANPDVMAELEAGKAGFGTKEDLPAAAWSHYLTYGKAGGRKYTKKAAEGGLAALTMANGGMAGQYDLGGYSDGGRLLRGPGDGVSDSIPATIGGKRPARLADGEFVVPARIVSELGNGSTEAGARKLYAMMDRVQAARKGSIGKGKVAKNSRADKYLPA